MNKNLLYRSIPKVDILLADEGIKVLIETYSRESVMEAIHSEMEKLRAYTEYEESDQWNGNHPAYESWPCPDKLRAYDEGS